MFASCLYEGKPHAASCDPHNEHVWEDASDANERAIMVSRSYKPGSVLDRVSRAIPDAQRC